MVSDAHTTSLVVTPSDRKEEQTCRTRSAGCGFEDGSTSPTFGYVHPRTTVQEGQV